MDLVSAINCVCRLEAGEFAVVDNCLELQMFFVVLKVFLMLQIRGIERYNCYAIALRDNEADSWILGECVSEVLFLFD